MTFISEGDKIIMVDSGLSQGSIKSDEFNLLPLPVPPKEIDTVIVTHAHLDHSGYLPRLVKKGFKGSIICTPPTRELIKIILEDCATLNESQQAPLYDMVDVKKTMKLIRTYPWHETFALPLGQGSFVPAGHILGASSFILEGQKRIVFSGDLGRSDDYLLPPPPPCPSADLVIIESTYGGKNREGNMHEELASLLKRVHDEKKVAIFASFALARGQMLLTSIEQYFSKHPEQRVAVYFDSPMMKKVNEVYERYSDLTRIPLEMVDSLKKANAVDFIGQWNTLKKKTGPVINIASSGMVTGGRIFRHLQNWQNDPNALLFLAGYQGENTPGRLFWDGIRTIKNLEGDSITWSGEIVKSGAFSAHAEQRELLEWIRPSGAKQIFLIHGEEQSKNSLKSALENLTPAAIIIPQRNEVQDI